MAEAIVARGTNIINQYDAWWRRPVAAPSKRSTDILVPLGTVEFRLGRSFVALPVLIAV
jgi:hypothetical protein